MCDSKLRFSEVFSLLRLCFSKEKTPAGALGIKEHKQLCWAWHTTQLTHCAQQQTSTIFLHISKSSN